MEVGTIGTCLTVAQGTCTGTGVLKLIGGMFFGFGGAVLVILGAVITIGLAYLVFKFGWKKVKGSVR